MDFDASSPARPGAMSYSLAHVMFGIGLATVLGGGLIGLARHSAGIGVFSLAVGVLAMMIGLFLIGRAVYRATQGS